MRAVVIAIALGLVACSGAAPVPSKKPAEARVTQEAIDARAWLAPSESRAIAAGAGPIAASFADAVAEGDRVGAFVEVPESSCLLAIARPSAAIGDVDLFAFDDEGSVIAADESPEREAGLTVCPPHPKRLYVSARVMAGSGFLAVGVMLVPVDRADAAARAVGARGKQGEDTGRFDAWPGLEGRHRAHRTAIGSSFHDQRRAVLPVGSIVPSLVTATVEPGRCLDVLASPSEELASIELVAQEPSGRIIARGRELGRDRVMVICSQTAGEITFGVRGRGGEGLVAVLLGRSKIGAEAELAADVRVVHLVETRSLDDARRELDRDLKAAYEPKKAIGAGVAKVGSKLGYTVDLPKGCARIDAIAGKPLAGVSASLWDDKGLLLGDTRGGAGAAIFACGKGGPARLDLEALESGGPIAAELRVDRSAPPQLVAHPLAAARLLGRLYAAALASNAAEAAGALVIAIDAQTLRTLSVPTPAGSCAEVIVALDAGALGVELDLWDGAGERTIARGDRVASGKVCAAAGKPSKAEVHASAGRADALVLIRVEDKPRE